MQYIEVKSQVPKEAYELAQGLVEIAKAVNAALADGFQPGHDIPKIIMDAIAILPPALQGYDRLDDEMKADGIAFAKAFNLAGYDLLEALKPKAEEVQSG